MRVALDHAPQGKMGNLSSGWGLTRTKESRYWTQQSRRAARRIRDGSDGAEARWGRCPGAHGAERHRVVSRRGSGDVVADGRIVCRRLPRLRPRGTGSRVCISDFAASGRLRPDRRARGIKFCFTGPRYLRGTVRLPLEWRGVSHGEARVSTRSWLGMRRTGGRADLYGGRTRPRDFCGYPCRRSWRASRPEQGGGPGSGAGEGRPPRGVKPS